VGGAATAPVGTKSEDWIRVRDMFNLRSSSRRLQSVVVDGESGGDESRAGTVGERAARSGSAVTGPVQVLDMEAPLAPLMGPGGHAGASAGCVRSRSRPPPRPGWCRHR